jgi:heme exporter protein D
MGGYAAYVWPAYGFALLVLVALVVQSWRSARRRDTELEQLRHLARPGRASRPVARPATAAAEDTRNRSGGGLAQRVTD